jgi:hypothetical protein
MPTIFDYCLAILVLFNILVTLDKALDRIFEWSDLTINLGLRARFNKSGSRLDQCVWTSGICPYWSDLLTVLLYCTHCDSQQMHACITVQRTTQ